jgi:NAD(P)-dependent dehydrogenase (short-subunit alcohol dehydrogenase family)
MDTTPLEGKVALVTGAGRNIGRAIALALADAGAKVAVNVRASSDEGQSVVDEVVAAGGDALLVVADVAQRADVDAMIAAIAKRFGRLDIVVNNAGRGVLGAVEEVSDDAARAVFDVNVFGTLNVQRAVLPVLRRQRSGHILNISSVAGVVGMAGWGIYNATKFAMTGFSEALQQELEPLGVKLTLVEPGYFRTDFLDGSSLDTEPTVIEDYAGTAGAMRGLATDYNHTQPGDPVKGAKAIVDIAEQARPPLHLLLGTDSLGFARTKLRAELDELVAWQEVSASTDHDDVAAR